MNKTALITGSQGFVGSYLKRELKKNGYSVFGIGYKNTGDENYSCVDITDKKLLQTTIEAIKPKYVFDLAGVSSPWFAEKNPELTYNVNVEGTRNLLDVLLSVPGVKVLVVSSGYVYGRPDLLPIKEDHPLNGEGVYAESRIKQEGLVKSYEKKMDIVVARSFNHTGPVQNDSFVVPKIISQVIEIKKGSRDFLELGNVDIRRDILDVRDVVRAYVMLLDQEKFGITCNVCRGRSISLKEVVEYGKVFAGLGKIEIKANPEFIHKDEVLDFCGDNGYLRDLIDWGPQVDYEIMLRGIFNYWDKI